MSCAYDDDLTAATQVCDLVVEGTLSTAGNSIKMEVELTAGYSTSATDGVIVTSAAAVATTNTISPATTIRQNHGASTGLSAVLKDQFGAVMLNQAVTVVTTGRNVTASAANGVTVETRKSRIKYASIHCRSRLISLSLAIKKSLQVLSLSAPEVTKTSVSCQLMRSLNSSNQTLNLKFEGIFRLL